MKDITDRIDITKITVDTSLHEKLGFTILDTAPSRGKRPTKEEWPPDEAFTPSGITFEEAKAAMRKCM